MPVISFTKLDAIGTTANSLLVSDYDSNLWTSLKNSILSEQVHRRDKLCDRRDLEKSVNVPRKSPRSDQT